MPLLDATITLSVIETDIWKPLINAAPLSEGFLGGNLNIMMMVQIDLNALNMSYPALKGEVFHPL
jgi:hypothetical protein